MESFSFFLARVTLTLPPSLIAVALFGARGQLGLGLGGRGGRGRWDHHHNRRRRRRLSIDRLA